MSDVIAPRVRAVENMVARAQAVTGGRNTQGACLTCHIKLWFSFFFDGTGNHKENDFPTKHSNVAALTDAHLDDRPNGIAAFYYEGIGTAFEFKDRYESDTIYTEFGPQTIEAKGYRENESTLNKAFGTGIDKRLEKAMLDFQIYVDQWRRQRRVDEINIAAFGFSRGATTARAFMHWLRAHSKMSFKGGKLAYDGIPVNIKFLGVFDTVESIGSAGDNEQPDLIKTSVPSYVEKCCHIVAAHELRRAFPVTVLGTSRYTQVVYPGAHADIGGGYTDGEQGRTNSLARVALLQMLDEARGAGLKMSSLGEMKNDVPAWNAKLKKSFDVPSSTRTALSHYMKHVQKPSGPLADVFASHCALYHKWIDAGLAVEDADTRLDAARSQRNTPGGRERFNEAVVEYHLKSNLAKTPRGRGASISGGPDRKAVPPEVESFFERYVHDSFQHFSLSGGTMQSDFTNADYYKLRGIHHPKA